MDLSTLFTISTLAIVPAWLLLLLAPHWRWTDRLVQTLPVFLLFCAAYWLLRIVRPDPPDGASLDSLAGLMIALSDPYSVMVTWIHILVIDLFVGAWMVRDARRNEIHHGLVAPCLLVAFVAAPIGLLLYGAIRIGSRRVTVVDTPQAC